MARKEEILKHFPCDEHGESENMHNLHIAMQEFGDDEDDEVEGREGEEGEVKEKQKYIKLGSYRSKGINAYLAPVGKDHTHNDYGTPIDDENQLLAYRKKFHTVQVRIDTLADGFYKYVEARGHKPRTAYLQIKDGEIEAESEILTDLVVGELANSLPPLYGSSAQVDWAKTLRLNAISRKILDGEPIPEEFTQTKEAKWFIDNRTTFWDPENIVKLYFNVLDKSRTCG